MGSRVAIFVKFSMWQGNNALIPVLNSNLVLHDYDLEKKQSYEIQKLFMYYYV